MKGRITKSSDNTYEGNAFAGQKQFRFSVVCGFEMTRERLYQLKTIETMKKCLYLLLILLLLPLAVHADDSGPCGDNVSYVYEEATGTLTISRLQ